MSSFEHQAESQRIDIKSPEELRCFFKTDGIRELAEPLDYILQRDGIAEGGRLSITDKDDNGEFSVYWQNSATDRLLVVQSNLARIAGLHLIVPVRSDSYELAGGSIGAAISPRLSSGHKIEHYLQKGEGLVIGNPNTAVKVHQIAKWELLEASSTVAVSEVNVT